MLNILYNFEKYLLEISFWTYIFAFLGGVLMSFTPCVYPLIPITIGYIGSQSIGSKFKGFFLSIFYVLGFSLVYSLIGLMAALTGRLFGEWIQTPLSYILIGNICLLFSLSLFEVFSLPAPIFFKKRIENRKKGFFGAFLMGMISALITNPCTLPVLGAILLFITTKRNVLLGMSLLLVFSYGMGLILVLTGTFTGLLAGLPKSGSWLIRIKKFFAWFLLLMSEYYFLKAGKVI